MRIMSWNVNSVRAREQRLLALLARQSPDVLCLQELKVVDDQFPTEAVQALGYHVATHGQKTYNGVAILSRTPLSDVRRSLDDGVDDPQARFIVAETAGVRVASAYVPNGSELASDKWPYKLEWYARLRRWLEANARVDEPFALCGDFNVAPDDRDVAQPAAWAETVLCHPLARAALAAVTGWGLVDTYRERVTDGGHYSWWDYRNLGFPKNDGLRIDFVLATSPLAARLKGVAIDRDERKGEKPSDHAPVYADF